MGKWGVGRYDTIVGNILTSHLSGCEFESRPQPEVGKDVTVVKGIVVCIYTQRNISMYYMTQSAMFVIHVNVHHKNKIIL